MTSCWHNNCIPEQSLLQKTLLQCLADSGAFWTAESSCARTQCAALHVAIAMTYSCLAASFAPEREKMDIFEKPSAKTTHKYTNGHDRQDHFFTRLSLYTIYRGRNKGKFTAWLAKSTVKHLAMPEADTAKLTSIVDNFSLQSRVMQMVICRRQGMGCEKQGQMYTEALPPVMWQRQCWFAVD